VSILPKYVEKEKFNLIQNVIITIKSIKIAIYSSVLNNHLGIVLATKYMSTRTSETPAVRGPVR